MSIKPNTNSYCVIHVCLLRISTIINHIPRFLENISSDLDKFNIDVNKLSLIWTIFPTFFDLRHLFLSTKKNVNRFRALGALNL